MAHKKGAGSSKNGRESESKRLGVKIFGGQAAIAGNIILRQRGNTHDYLNSKTEIPLREPFSIPHVEYLTICDSEYVGGLEIAHALANILRETIKGAIAQEIKTVSDFMRIEHFIGHKKKGLITG